MYNSDLENVGELKLFHGAIETLKAYVERQIESNNGVFPPSNANDILTFIYCMQNELIGVASLIESSNPRFDTSYCDNNLNCTLDNVEIPQSFLDDDIEIMFETSALEISSPPPNYRGRQSIASVYFSANSSVDGTQSDSDDENVNQSISLDRQLIEAITADDLVVEPYEIENTDNNEVFDGIIERDCKTPEVVACGNDDTDSVTSNSPPTHCDIKEVFETRNKRGRTSDVSSVCSDKDRMFETEVDDEDLKTPPPSPDANNSIDAITQAIQAIRLNSSLEAIGKAGVIKESIEQKAPDNEFLLGPRPDFIKYDSTRRSSDVSNLSRSPLKDIQVASSHSIC